ncbi:MAG: CHASE2 domain-containing protein [Syntrophothermus sp.]
MFRKILKFAEQKEWTIWVISLLSFLAVCLLNLTGLFTNPEHSVDDYKFVRYAGTLKADTNIVLVAIDQKSLDFFDREKVGWPWPREFYSYAVSYFTKCGASAVAFDIDFSSRETDRLETDSRDSEAKFSEAMKLSGRVFLGASLNNERGSSITQKVIDGRFLLKKNPFTYPAEFNSANAPLPVFQTDARSVASTNIFPDKDGVIRRVPLQLSYKGGCLPVLPFSIFLNMNNIREDQVESSVSSIPLSAGSQFLINWYGGGGPGSVFRYYSIHSVIVSWFKIKNNIPPDIPENLFKNKIVIIGGTAVGLLDNKVVPVSALGPYPGMELHATVLSNLMHKEYAVPAPQTAVWAAGYLLCLITAFFFFRIKNVWLAVVLSLALLTAYCSLSFWMFYLYRLLLPVIMPSSGILLAFIGSAVFRYSTEGRQKKELKRIFSRYLNPHVVEDLIKDPNQIDLEGKVVSATVYFSDIENFTNISEALEPKKLVGYLNKYFSVCTSIILRYNGLLDKYIGDSVMAVFGVPNAIQDHALNACLAALDNLKEINKLYTSENSGMPYFNTRIGIHSGSMVVGNIGTESHLDYTVIGDSVNLASRLEGVNKMFGTNIIISESTYELVKEHIEARLLDNLSVKGKSIPVRIYELAGRKGELGVQELQYISDFEEAIRLYRSREWEKALHQFTGLMELRPGDKAAGVYIGRCSELLKQGNPAEWDEVTRLNTK